MARHTPGPWQTIGWSPQGIYGPGDIGAVRVAQLDSRLDPNEATANARLIAAAPTLLDALVDLDQYLRDTPHHNATQAAAARAAIAKATTP